MQQCFGDCYWTAQMTVCASEAGCILLPEKSTVNVRDQVRQTLEGKVALLLPCVPRPYTLHRKDVTR